MISSKAYLTRFALFALLLILPFVAHGLLVDPYGIWGTRLIPEKGYERFGRIKTKGDRVVKGIHLARFDNDVIMIGNSRIVQGHDPADAAFAGLKVYNAAMPGGRYLEMAGSMRGASFLNMKDGGDYALSTLSGESLATGYMSATFGGSAIDESLRFWKIVRKREPWTVNMQGLDRRSEMHVGSYREHFIKLADSATTPCGDNDDLARLLKERMAEFEKSLIDMRKRGIRVDLVLPTRHILPLAFEEMAQKTVLHELFKRLAVDVVERVKQAPGTGAITLWDFNDVYPEIALDPVPPDGSTEAAKYFYEASHYNLIVGSAMSATIMGKTSPFPGFGKELTRANLETQIATVRARLKDWMDTHPQELALLKERTDAKIRCSRMEVRKMKAGH